MSVKLSGDAAVQRFNRVHEVLKGIGYVAADPAVGSALSVLAGTPYVVTYSLATGFDKATVERHLKGLKAPFRWNVSKKGNIVEVIYPGDPAVDAADSERRDLAAWLTCPDRLRLSGLMTAILACLLGEEWTNPKIAELVITSDGFVMARREGDIGHNEFIGSDRDLLANLMGIAATVDMTREENDWLLALTQPIRMGTAAKV